jgi:hypothetical protein
MPDARARRKRQIATNGILSAIIGNRADNLAVSSGQASASAPIGATAANRALPTSDRRLISATSISQDCSF